MTAVQELKGLGKEFVFVIHVMSFDRDFADYVIFMDKGENVDQGLPEIMDNPMHEAIRVF